MLFLAHLVPLKSTIAIQIYLHLRICSNLFPSLRTRAKRMVRQSAFDLAFAVFASVARQSAFDLAFAVFASVARQSGVKNTKIKTRLPRPSGSQRRQGQIATPFGLAKTAKASCRATLTVAIARIYQLTITTKTSQIRAIRHIVSKIHSIPKCCERYRK